MLLTHTMLRDMREIIQGQYEKVGRRQRRAVGEETEAYIQMRQTDYKHMQVL